MPAPEVRSDAANFAQAAVATDRARGPDGLGGFVYEDEFCGEVEVFYIEQLHGQGLLLWPWYDNAVGVRHCLKHIIFS